MAKKGRSRKESISLSLAAIGGRLDLLVSARIQYALRTTYT